MMAPTIKDRPSPSNKEVTREQGRADNVGGIVDWKGRHKDRKKAGSSMSLGEKKARFAEVIISTDFNRVEVESLLSHIPWKLKLEWLVDFVLREGGSAV